MWTYDVNICFLQRCPFLSVNFQMQWLQERKVARRTHVFRIYPYLYLEDRRASMIMCTDLKTCRYNSTLTMLTSACDEILHKANSLARRTTIFKSGLRGLHVMRHVHWFIPSQCQFR